MKQLRYVVYILSLFFIFSYYIPYSETSIEEDVRPYYNEYVSLRDFYCNDKQYFEPKFQIVYNELYGDVIGLCQVRPNSFKISIRKSYWDKMIEVDKLNLLAHELTHCWFSEPHTKDPSNFMAEYQIHIPKDELYKQFKTYLKTKCKK